jgi:hypothetical protein
MATSAAPAQCLDRLSDNQDVALFFSQFGGLP